MSQNFTPFYVFAAPLALDSSLSGTSSVSFLFVALSMLLHSLNSHSYLLYCQRMLEDAIAVVPNYICGAMPVFWCVEGHYWCDIVVPGVGDCSTEE